MIQVGDDHGCRVRLEAPAKVVADQCKGLGHGTSTAVAANHGYLDRAVHRASLRATRIKNG